MSVPEPTLEQVQQDKQFMSDYTSKYNSMEGDKTKKDGGLAGFIILGILAFYVLAYLAVKIYEDAMKHKDATTAGAFIVGCLAIAAIVCSIVFGKQFMDKIYDDEIAKKKAEYKNVNSITLNDIEKRKAQYPKLYYA